MMVGPGQVVAGGIPISQLALMLSQFTQRIVVDRTGLAGNFEIDLDVYARQIAAGATASWRAAAVNRSKRSVDLYGHSGAAWA